MSDQRPAAMSDRRTDRARLPLDREAAADHARRLATLTDPTRVQLISLFMQDAGPLNVDEIAAALGIGCNAATAHLAALTEVGLLTAVWRGGRECFQINGAYARCLPALTEAVLGRPRILRP
ncbi:ArsR family transcriptional regulator [Actinomadura sp. SCN-SB]|uniref:ArsR family transcriptional regulator n=1 Tax=Actinomadura sp. SCN-SB TaxID=3373092 RepID=UPI0037523A49